eukprot:1157239-Pelagomonas_calceolata.AAC.7
MKAVTYGRRASHWHTWRSKTSMSCTLSSPLPSPPSSPPSSASASSSFTPVYEEGQHARFHVHHAPTWLMLYSFVCGCSPPCQSSWLCSSRSCSAPSQSRVRAHAAMEDTLPGSTALSTCGPRQGRAEIWKHVEMRKRGDMEARRRKSMGTWKPLGQK